MHSNSIDILEQKLTNLTSSVKDKSTKHQQDSNIHGEQYSQNKIKDSSLTISYTILQKMPIKIKNILEDNFNQLIELCIMNCDLRTFQNFPKLLNLRNLNVSKNSLRGSFEFLVKNRTIRYIDVSNNMINDVKKFEPLRCLKNITIYAKQNPFICRNNMGGLGQSKNFIRDQLKNLGIKLLDRPLQLKREMKKEEVKLEKIQSGRPEQHKNEQGFGQVKQKCKRVIEKLLRKEILGRIKNTQREYYRPFHTQPQRTLNSFNLPQLLNEARQLQPSGGSSTLTANLTRIYRERQKERERQRQRQRQRQRERQREKQRQREIQRERERAFQNKAPRLLPMTNFYQIIHSQQAYVQHDDSNEEVKVLIQNSNSENIHLEQSEHSQEDEEDIPQIIPPTKLAEFDIIEFDKQEMRVYNENHDEDNDEDNEEQNAEEIDFISLDEYSQG